ncbi:MAG TPA: hypothetical protein VIM47_00795 [Dermatophilaceae bacterium]
MSERCELSDLPVDQCACRVHAPKPERLETRDYVITARFPARFDSECDGCEKDIAEGDPIARTDAGDYICAACAS